MSCNEWQGCQEHCPQQPWELAGGQQAAHHSCQGTMRGKHGLAGICSLSGGAFGQKGRAGVGLEKSQLEAVWKFSLEWQC